eukprot:5745445-Prymnesium_polylepis.1
MTLDGGTRGSRRVAHVARTSTPQKRKRTTKHSCQRSVCDPSTLYPPPQNVRASDRRGPQKKSSRRAPQSRQTAALAAPRPSGLRGCS